MNRRELIQSLGSIGGALMVVAHPSAKTNESLPDAFEIQDWHVRWIGWRQIPNQILEMGYWVAWRDADDYHWVSCTMGVCAKYHEFDCVDTSRQKWGHVISPIHGDDRDEAKRHACIRLLKSLQTGVAWNSGHYWEYKDGKDVGRYVELRGE